MEEPIWRVAENINKQSRTADNGWSSNLGLGELLKTPYRNTLPFHETYVPRAWTDTLVQPKQWKGDMKFDIWNVRSLHNSGSLISAAGD
jgi:hypothetical protein